MARAASPPGPGPQTGAPPSLEQIPLDRLSVDPAYQRATDGMHSQRLIASMFREWKWPLCQPLVVSRRAEGENGGGLYVLDGQHRLAGARARGDIPYLPCVVLSSLDQGGEATAFVDLNTQRQKLSQADIFNGRLAAGDPDAKQLATLLEQTRWRQVRNSATDSWKPGDLVCAPMLVNRLKMYDAQTVTSALTALRKAYPDIVVTAPAKLLEALILNFRPQGPLRDLDPDVVAAAMAQVRAPAWMIRAESLRSHEPGLGQLPALARLIVQAVYPNRNSAPAPPRPVTAVRPPPAAPDGLNPAAFGTSGKGWCKQCEQLVSRECAAACKWKGCAMRGDQAT